MTYRVRAFCNTCFSEHQIEITDEHPTLEDIKCPSCKSTGLKSLDN